MNVQYFKIKAVFIAVPNNMGCFDEQTDKFSMSDSFVPEDYTTLWYLVVSAQMYYYAFCCDSL